MNKTAKLWASWAIAVCLNLTSNPSNSAEYETEVVTKCLAIAATIDNKNGLIACNSALKSPLSDQLKELLLLSRAHILLLLGKQKESLADLEAARILNPKSSLILSKIANYKQFDDPEESVKLYLEALNHAQKNDAAILNGRFLTFVLRSSSRASKNGNYLQAVSLINSALERIDNLSIQHQLLAFRGRMKLQLGYEAQAFEDWQSAIDLAPDLPWAYLARGLHFYGKNKANNALIDFGASYQRRGAAAAFIIPKEPYVQLLQQKGQQFLSEQDLFSAAKMYRRILDISSASDLKPLKDYFLAKILEQIYAKNFEAAKNSAKIAISFFKDINSKHHIIEFQLRLASIFKDNGNEDEALLALRSAYKSLNTIVRLSDFNSDSFDGVADLYVRLAIVLLKSGEIENAENASRSAIEFTKSKKALQKVSESLGDMWYLIGHQVAGPRAYALAQEVYERSISNSIDNVEINRVQLKLAKIMKNLGQFDDALKIIDRVLKKTPNLAQAHIDKAKLKLKLGNIDVALMEFDLASNFAKSAGEKLQIHTSLASQYMKIGDDVRALGQYKAALKIAPANTLTLHNIGLLYKKRNKLDDALTYFSRAIILDSKSFQSLFERGKIYLVKSKYEEALQDFGRYLSSDKITNRENRFQANFFSAISLFSLNRIDGAKKIFEKLSAFGGEEPRIYLWLARVAARQGKIKEAIVNFDKSLPNLSQKDVADYQTILRNKGFRIGVIDGKYGPATRKALAACIARRCF